MRELKIILACIAAVVLCAGAAFAQIDNGDFESGGDGWTAEADPGWSIEFRTEGGNPDGYVWLMSPFGDSGGESCVSQEFFCGEPGDDDCVITFDYYTNWIDSNEMAGRVKVYVDGNLLFTSPDENEIDWTNATVTVACGTHTIDLCLEVDQGNNGWEAGFDNVTADCDAVPNDSKTWTGLKALYR